MNEDLKNKLLKDIIKTGYPLELQVGNIFRRAGWRNVQHSRYYIDLDEQKGREIDISAYENALHKEESVVVKAGLHLVCEIKQTVKKPWVIFSTEKRDWDLIEGGLPLKPNYGNAIGNKLLSASEIAEGSSVSRFSRIGRTYREGFKGKTEHCVIFQALTSVVKASEYCLKVNQEAYERLKVGMDPKKEQEIYFVDPILVIDGLLYEAYMNEKEAIELNQTDHALISFGYISPEYTSHCYLVDLVTIRELPNLLTTKLKWIHNIKDAIVKEL